MEFRLFLKDFCLPLRNSTAFQTLPPWNGNGPPQQGVHGFFLEKPILEENFVKLVYGFRLSVQIHQWRLLQ